MKKLFENWRKYVNEQSSVVPGTGPEGTSGIEQATQSLIRKKILEPKPKSAGSKQAAANVEFDPESLEIATDDFDDEDAAAEGTPSAEPEAAAGGREAREFVVYSIDTDHQDKMVNDSYRDVMTSRDPEEIRLAAEFVRMGEKAAKDILKKQYREYMQAIASGQVPLTPDEIKSLKKGTMIASEPN